MALSAVGTNRIAVVLLDVVELGRLLDVAVGLAHRAQWVLLQKCQPQFAPPAAVETTGRCGLAQIKSSSTTRFKWISTLNGGVVVALLTSMATV